MGTAKEKRDARKADRSAHKSRSAALRAAREITHPNYVNTPSKTSASVVSTPISQSSSRRSSFMVSSSTERPRLVHPFNSPGWAMRKTAEEAARFDRRG